jgi:hypothetical protein
MRLFYDAVPIEKVIKRGIKWEDWSFLVLFYDTVLTE